MSAIPQKIQIYKKKSKDVPKMINNMNVAVLFLLFYFYYLFVLNFVA